MGVKLWEPQGFAEYVQHALLGSELKSAQRYLRMADWNASTIDVLVSGRLAVRGRTLVFLTERGMAAYLVLRAAADEAAKSEG